MPKKSPYLDRYKILVRSAKKRDIPVNLTFEEYLEFAQTTECRYCTKPIYWAISVSLSRDHSYYLDRKNNMYGYSKDNCCVCCARCNRFKGSELTYAEMLLIGKTFKLIDSLRLRPKPAPNYDYFSLDNDSPWV